MEKFKRNLLWFISVLFILISLTYINEIPVQSILLLAVGIILLPPMNKRIKEKINNLKKVQTFKYIRNLIAITMFISFLYQVPDHYESRQNEIFSKSDFIEESSNYIAESTTTESITEKNGTYKGNLVNRKKTRKR